MSATDTSWDVVNSKHPLWSFGEGGPLARAGILVFVTAFIIMVFDPRVLGAQAARFLSLEKTWTLLLGSNRVRRDFLFSSWKWLRVCVWGGGRCLILPSPGHLV